MNYNKIKKYSILGIEKIINNLQTSIYLNTGFFMPKPMKVYYLMSNKCNFQCQMCPQWKMGQSEKLDDYISKNRIKSIIDEMKDLGIKEFGMSGGEPLIFKDTLLELLKYANSKGIYTHFATNGSLLDDKFLKKYDNIGGGHISLSIDGIGDKHDSLRGYKTAYDGVKNVLNLFADNNYKNLVLKINITLSNENLDEIMNILLLAKKAKAIVFIQPFDTYEYGNRDLDCRAKKYPLWVGAENYLKLKKLVESLLTFKKNNPEILLNDKKHIESIYDYFTDEKFYQKCYAFLDQVTINPFGKAIFCKFGEIDDLKKITLKNYLKSKKRKTILKASLECREGCLLGCMFRSGLMGLIKNGSKQFFKLIK